MKNKNISKIFFLVFSYILCSNLANAQDTLITIPKTKVVSLNKVKVYFFGIGYEKEQKITSLRTIYFNASIENVAPFLPQQPNGYSDVVNVDKLINISPVISLGVRKYNNFKEREKAGKTTENNSGGFLGFELSLIAPILINRNYTTKFVGSLSPIFGFQKNISKHKNLEFSLGPSLQSDFSDYRLSGFVKFGLNFLL